MLLSALSFLLAAGLFPRTRSIDVKGVAPWQAAKYEKLDGFRCGANNGIVATVNDQVCECPQGEDEPGTAACAHLPILQSQRERLLDHALTSLPFRFIEEISGRYYERPGQIDWVNRKWAEELDDWNHTSGRSTSNGSPAPLLGFYCPQRNGSGPLIIPHSRVGDLVCDCCDGSDELEGSCANVCSEQKLERERLAKRLNEKAQRLKAMYRDRFLKSQHLPHEWEELKVNGYRRLEQLRAKLEEERTAGAQSQATQRENDKNKDDHENGQSENGAQSESGEDDGKMEGIHEKKKAGVSEYAKWMNDLEDSAEKGGVGKNGSSNGPMAGGFFAGLVGKWWNIWSRYDPNVELKEQLESVGRSTSGSSSDQAVHVSLAHVLEREIADLDEKIKLASSRSTHPLFSKHAVLLELQGRNFDYSVGERRYSVGLESVTRSEGWHGQRVSFGVNPEYRKEDPTLDNILPGRYRHGQSKYLLHYKNGSSCQNGSQNGSQNGKVKEAKIWLACHEHEKLIYVEEKEFSCLAVGVLATPLGCMDQINNPSAARRKRAGAAHPQDEL